jgi:tetrahydromethanopterin S-methyltransferase subunit E
MLYFALRVIYMGRNLHKGSRVSIPGFLMVAFCFGTLKPPPPLGGGCKLIRTPDIKGKEEKGWVQSFACPYTQVEVGWVVTGLCNYVATISSEILTQLQGNAGDTRTKRHNLSYGVKSAERRFSNFVFIDDISISRHCDVRRTQDPEWPREEWNHKAVFIIPVALT